MTLTPAPPELLPDGSTGSARRSLRSIGGLDRVAGITATLVGTQAVTSLLGFVFWTIAAHRFAVSSIGVASDATSTMQLLGSFGMLGFGTLLISRLPAVAFDRRRVLVRSSLVVVALVSSMLGIVVAASVGLLPTSGLRAVAATPADGVLFAVGVALTGVTLVVDQAVLSAGSGLVQLERNIVASSAKIGFLIALSFDHQHGGMAIYLSWVLGTLVSMPVVALRTRNPGVRISRPRWLDRAALRGTMREAANHHVLNLALQAPLMLFPVIITVTASTRTTGYFTTVLLLSGFVFILPYAVSIGLFASAGGEQGSTRARMRLTIPFGLAASLAADAVLIPLAPIVLRIFGSGYEAHGVTALRLIVLAGLPFVIKDHFVALRRVEARPGAAARLILVTSVLEVVAAAIGARLDGTTGLCLVWLGLMYIEAVFFGAILLREMRGPSTRLTQRFPAEVLVGEVDSDGYPGDQAVAVPPAPPVPDRPPAPSVTPAVTRPSPRLGPVFFLMSLGVALEALAAVAGNATVTPAGVDSLFWAGLVLIFGPAAAIAISSRVSQGVRLGAVVVLGLLLQISRYALFPTQFVFHDELAHANTLRLIQLSHGLFSGNPLLPVSSYYPGLELVTDAIHGLTGLDNRGSAMVVLLLCRVVMTLGVYLGIERITRSGRIAAIASICYVCNEQYLFFNSQYSYQSLALPLALFTVYLLLRLPVTSPARWRSMVLPFAAVAAVTVSHHLTAALLAVALCAWALVERWKRGRTPLGRAVAQTGALSVITVVAWAFIPGNPVRTYLVQIASTAGDAITAFVERKQSHALFEAGGYRTPTWEIAVSVGSELLVVACMVLALRSVWRHRTWRTGSLALLLCLLSVIWPIVPAGHLTGATSEVTDRASGFVFLGVGFVVACWLEMSGRWRRSDRLGSRWRVLLGGGLLVAFVGQTILGSGPQWAQTPGSFLVSADSRSIDKAELAAAHWEAAHLPLGARIIADRDSSLLAGVIGGLYPVTHVADGINGSAILLSPTWTTTDRSLVRRLRIAYVVIDLRDATGLPREGIYYESGEYDQNRTSPVPLQALTKLNDVPGVTRIYDNGPMVIYDVRALEGTS
jgi:O-antigen/teichoic acid export membrane protein